MVDIMSHGGDAGGDMPFQGGSRVHSQCESCKYYESYILDLF